jgi:hypothetical protein
MDNTILAAIIMGICAIIAPVITYSTRSCSFGEKALQAKNSVFCSSLIMAQLNDFDIQNDFMKVNSEIPITIVLLNSNNPDMIKTLQRFNGYSLIENEKTIIEGVKIGIDRILSNKRNVTVKYKNFIIPNSYFAVDYKVKTDSSFIQIKQYLLNDNKGIKVLYCTVRPESELYELYREQILLLERSNEDFSNWS